MIEPTRLLDDIDSSVSNNLYPLSLPSKHLKERIPPTLTISKILLYYTFWNWIVILVASVTQNSRVKLYASSSTLLVATLVSVAWFKFGWQFFETFYSGILQTKTPWLIAFADFLFHYAPFFIVGMPKYVALPLFMPFITFWVWYMAVRNHIKELYGGAQPFEYDRVVVIGTVIWIAIIWIWLSM